MRTYTPKAADVTNKKWYIVDAENVVLGRLATTVANLLRGKHKPTYAPHIDTGDYVIVISADKVVLTGNKLDTKRAYRHSGYPGGLRSLTYRELLEKSPEKAVEKAVRGMVPHTKLGRAQMKKLRVFVGSEHPHTAQQPETVEIKKIAQ